MIKHIIMDLGDTIIDNSKFDLSTGFAHLYSRIHCPKISQGEFINQCMMIKLFTFDARGTTEFSFQTFLNYLRAYFIMDYVKSISEIEKEVAMACRTTSLVEGVLPLLVYCDQHHITLSILSNSAFSSDALLAQIAPTNIGHYFLHVISSSDIGIRKPSRHLFELALKNAKTDINNTLYVGNDYEIDVKGAHLAGLRVCWFNQHTLPNVDDIPCLDINHYQPLIQFLQNEENYD